LTLSIAGIQRISMLDNEARADGALTPDTTNAVALVNELKAVTS
jgi:hypothetical protein